MSLNNELEKATKKVIQQFIKQVVSKYNLDENEIMSLWEGKNLPNKKVTTSSLVDVDTEDLSLERLMKCTVPELKGFCRSKGVKLSGKKADLISRLTGVDESQFPEKPAPKKSSKKKEKKSEAPIIDKLMKNKDQLTFRRNKYNNLENSKTKLVVDKITSKVIGKQQDDGTVSELLDEDIEICKKYKLTYVIPENLDSKVSIENVKVDELDIKSEVEESESEEEVELDEEEEVELDEEVELEEEEEVELEEEEEVELEEEDDEVVEVDEGVEEWSESE